MHQALGDASQIQYEYEGPVIRSSARAPRDEVAFSRAYRLKRQPRGKP
jgi:hypothetical protein